MNPIDRRALLAGLAAGPVLAASGLAAAQDLPRLATGTPQTPVEIGFDPEPKGVLTDDVIELWPEGRVPGAQGVTVRRQILQRGSPERNDRAVMHVTRPILEVFRPASPNGAAVIILPGGGYVRLAIDKEGAGGANRMTAAGATAFVLNYRLPGDGWAAGYDAPLQDIQRAVRIVRSRAAEFGLDPARIGVMGFSAGGHLAAAALTRFDDAVYEPIDAQDQTSARPDFACLGYAVMAIGARPGDFRGPLPSAASQSLAERVRPDLAPTFILHAADDRTVPVANSLAMFQALKTAEVPAELHIYEEGGHGFGFSLPPEAPASHWPDAFVAWAQRRRIFT